MDLSKGIDLNLECNWDDGIIYTNSVTLSSSYRYHTTMYSAEMEEGTEK